MESFDQLTTEEIEDAILKAAAKKTADRKSKEYWELVNNPPKLDISWNQFLKEILKEASEEIKGFSLNNQEQEIYKTLAMYFTGDKEFESRSEGYDLKKGILMFGNIGCGKTTAFKLFQSNPVQSYMVYPSMDVANSFKKKGYDFLERLYTLIPNQSPQMAFGQKVLTICFDDLGTETHGSHFKNDSNVMAEVILSRYERRSLTHLSTNLNPEEIENYYGLRVRDRMREMFNTIEFPQNSKSKRK